MKDMVITLGTDKWLVVAEAVYNAETYDYLVKVNQDEDEILDDKKVVKVIMDNGEKYMDEVTDGDILKNVVPLLVPEAKKYIANPELLSELK